MRDLMRDKLSQRKGRKRYETLSIAVLLMESNLSISVLFLEKSESKHKR